MNLTPLLIFEELRFALELLAGCAVFLLPFAKNKNSSLLPAIAGVAAACLVIMLRFPIINMAAVSPLLKQYMVVTVYIAASVIIMISSKIQFSLSMSDAIFFTAAGYAAQHIVYVLVHEVTARVLWTGVTERLIVYIIISIAGCTVVYMPLYRLFAPKLRLCRGRMMEDSRGNIMLNSALLIILIVFSFFCQDLFEFGGERRLNGAVLGVMGCIMMLTVLYEMLSVIRSSQNSTAMEQMLRDAEKHYNYSRELIEYVNRAVHDFKHTLRGLERADAGHRESYVSENTRLIEEYRKHVFTENELLNTILTEKALLCEKKKISFSASIQPCDLSFISIPDLYVLLGNAIDNAVEGADSVSDEEKRAVSFTVQTRGGSVIIQTENYYSGGLKLENGLPVTSKKDKIGHGYGLKSIRLIAEKYGGSVSAADRDNVFVLIILLPGTL